MDWAEATGANSWNKLYDRYYRKQEIYNMQWGEDVDLSKMKVSGAPFSGPLALLRDTSKISIVSASTVRNSLNIYSSAGGLLAEIPWKRGKVVEMGWTEREKLIVVLDDGLVLLYTIDGRLVQSFSMGDEFKNDRVMMACVWKSGVVCLSRNYSLVYVDDLAEPVPRRMPRLHDLESPPTCMAMIPPEMAASKGLEVLLAVGKTILSVDMASVTDQKLTAGPLRCMSVCPNGKMLACFTHDGFVWVITTDFSKNLSEFPTKSQVPPQQLVWCGTDSVVLYWDKMILMVGPYGDWVKYSYDEPLWLQAEADGVRVISKRLCEFLHRVPDSIVDIFKIGSCTAGAMLVDALELLERNDGRAHDTIRAIRDSEGLQLAVDTCLAAAAHEHYPPLQQLLLRAASYGASFMQMRTHTVVMEKTVGELRALNAVRHPSIGLPITKPQYNRLTAQALAQRIAERNQHYLALQLCNILRLDPRPVLVHWACQKILASAELSDAQLYSLISERIRGMEEACLKDARQAERSVSRADMAATALQENRHELAILLLDDEPSAADQVPLLMSMEEDQRALDKALLSQDPDLVFLALLHLLKKRGPQEVLKAVMRDETARGLMVTYCSHQDETLLRQLAETCDAPLILCHYLLPKAFKGGDLGRRSKALEAVKKVAAQAKDDHNAKFLCKQIEAECRLQEAQVELERLTGKAVFVDTPAAHTVRMCFALNQYSKGSRLYLLNQYSKGSRLAKDLNMSEKLLCSLKVQGLAEGHDWKELEKLSTERKVPAIGFEAFVEACIAHDRMDEAGKYADKISDMTRKAELCLRIGQFRKSAEAAIAAGDLEMLGSIRQKCTNPADMALIDNLIAQSGLTH